MALGMAVELAVAVAGEKGSGVGEQWSEVRIRGQRRRTFVARSLQSLMPLGGTRNNENRGWADVCAGMRGSALATPAHFLGCSSWG